MDSTKISLLIVWPPETIKGLLISIDTNYMISSSPLWKFGSCLAGRLIDPVYPVSNSVNYLPNARVPTFSNFHCRKPGIKAFPGNCWLKSKWTCSHRKLKDRNFSRQVVAAAVAAVLLTKPGVFALSNLLWQLSAMLLFFNNHQYKLFFNTRIL